MHVFVVRCDISQLYPQNQIVIHTFVSKGIQGI